MSVRMLLSCSAVLALFSLPAEAAAAAGAAPAVMLQIGASPTQAEADSASARFRKAHAATLDGVASEVRRAGLGTRGMWYRVLVGPFADRSAADRTCARLKAEGGACFLAPAEPQSVQAD